GGEGRAGPGRLRGSSWQRGSSRNLRRPPRASGRTLQRPDWRDRALMQRRDFLSLSLSLATTLAPLGGLSLLSACGKREPETPLAHLYGKDWVHGAYRHYAQVYIEVEGRARRRSTDSYKILAQRGVTSLTNL